MFDRVHEGVTNQRNVELAMEMGAYFELERGEWRQAGVILFWHWSWSANLLESAASPDGSSTSSCS
jgi:hypothetical protein